MISGHGTIDTAIEAIRKGAYDFIEKPLDLNRILITIKNATDKHQLIHETKTLKNKVSKKYDMIGNSEALNHIRSMIDKVAGFRCPHPHYRSQWFGERVGCTSVARIKSPER